MRNPATLALIACLAAASLPATASANAFTQATLTMEDGAFVLDVAARSPLPEPGIRVEPGWVRVRFAGVRQGWRELAGDGQRIRRVNLQQGIGDAGVAAIRLVDERTVAASAIATKLDGTRARVRIALAPLPPGAAAVPAAAVPVPATPTVAATKDAATPSAPTPVATLGTTDAPVAHPSAVISTATATPPHAPNTEVSGLFTTGPAVTDAPPAASAHAAAHAKTRLPLLAAAAPRPASAQRDTASTLLLAGTAPEAAGTAGLLMIASLLLGAIYATLRLVMASRKHRRPASPEIEVIGSKRIGPKHQLLVVRALGEDHLLSIHGGQTQRITSTPTPRDLDAEDADRRDGLHLIGARPSLAPRTARTSAAPAGPRLGAGPFGNELLSFLRTQSTPPERPARDADGPLTGLWRIKDRLAG